MPITHTPPEDLQRYRDSGAWLGKPLHGYIDEWAAQQPNHEAVVSSRARMTYAELASQSRQLAAGFQDLGLGLGDVVSIILPNAVEFILIHVALSRIGALINPFYLAFREHEISRFVNLAESKAIISIPSYGGFNFADALRSLSPQLPSVEHYLAVGEGLGQATPERFIDLTDVLRRGGSAVNFSDPGVGAEALLSLYFTSGTTGEPKGVLHIQDCPLSNAVHTMRSWACGPQEINLGLAPFGFAFGSFISYASLTSGGTLALLEAFTPEAFAQLVQQERVTYTFGGPAQARAVLDQGLHERYDFSSLNKHLFGGTVSPPDLIREACDALHCYPIALWGMTENYGTLHTRAGDDPEVAATSVGRPAVGNDLIIIDDAGAELPPGEVGELVHRGANMFLGYYKRDDLYRASFLRTSRGEGWFRTGDLAFKDEDGNVHIASRLKDMISRGGTKIYPAEIEALLVRHPKIAQVAIVGMPDVRLGERACLFAVTHGGVDLSLPEVLAFLQEQRVAKYKFPERLVLLDTMPLSPAAKIDKQALRARLSAAS